LVFLVIRQHRRARLEFEESILDFEEETQLRGGVQASAAAPASRSVSSQQESSYLSDFSVSSMNNIQSDSGESDPLTEADVFYAYGKYEAAEMLIKEAIQNEPNRLDLRFKLLEIYHGAGNKEAYEFESSELYDMLPDANDPAWLKAVELGRELAPENVMFGGGGGTAAANIAAAASVATDASALNASPAAGTTSTDADTTAGDFDLDFDFDVMDQSASDDFEAELAKLEGGLDDFDQGAKTGTGAENVVSFNPAETSAGDSSGSFGAGLGADVDEVGTKLDLAKAYIDMGDPEGARSILDEVLEEGNEKQRDEALELVQQMAS